MFKIGDFAKLSRVSVRMLRHYDKLGLLRPAYTDPATGYRYYTVDQLHALQRLHALRELGLSLDQVQQVWANDLDLESSHLEALLRLKQSELRRQLRETFSRLERIDQQLLLLRQPPEFRTAPYDITVKALPPQTALTCRASAPPLRPEEVFVLRESACHALDSVGIAFQSAFILLHNPTAIYHRAYDEAWPLEFEIAFTVASASDIPAIPLIKGYQLQARVIAGHATVATALHQGQSRSVAEAHSTIMAWITAYGGIPDCPVREVYLRHSFTDIQANLIEVQYPFRRVRITPAAPRQPNDQHQSEQE